MPAFKIDEVAHRLGIKMYWLQARLNADRRSSEPQLQFHHYIGRTPLWAADQLDALKSALADEIAGKRRPARELRRVDRDLDRKYG